MEPMDQAYMEELARVNAALEEALKAAEEANQAKSRFLSSMSHGIRTPMNAIVGMTSIALSHIDEKARVQDCLRKIQTASSHLMSPVNDVLDMSRIDSGRMALSEEDFSLPDLVHEVAVIVAPQAAQKWQALHTDIGGILEENLVGAPLLRLPSQPQGACPACGADRTGGGAPAVHQPVCPRRPGPPCLVRRRPPVRAANSLTVQKRPPGCYAPGALCV